MAADIGHPTQCYAPDVNTVLRLGCLIITGVVALLWPPLCFRGSPARFLQTLGDENPEFPLLVATYGKYR